MFNMDKPTSIVFFICIGVGLIFLVTVVVLDSLRRKKAERSGSGKTENLNPRDITYIENELRKTARNSVSLTVGEELQDPAGKTHFGGVPDVPPDFTWPTFECATFDDGEVKPRHLNFLMQIDLEQTAALDTDNVLPHEGLLSFFHVVDADVYGDSERDMGCLRVFWFKDKSSLKPAEVPDGLKSENRFPAVSLEMKRKQSYITPDDLFDYFDGGNNALDCYWEAVKNIDGADREESCSKLLGWADWVQYSDVPKFEKLYRGGNADETQLKNAPHEWLLLLELDPIYYKNFELVYGDSGSLYVYIRKEDLLARRFDKTVFTWQCT